jgi:hypothetical protein
MLAYIVVHQYVIYLFPGAVCVGRGPVAGARLVRARGHLVFNLNLVGACAGREEGLRLEGVLVAAGWTFLAPRARAAPKGTFISEFINIHRPPRTQDLFVDSWQMKISDEMPERRN